MVENLRHCARVRNRLTESIVFIRGDDVAGLVDVLRQVPVVLVCGEVEAAIARYSKEPSNPSGTLQGFGKVHAPEVLNLSGVRRRAADG